MISTTWGEALRWSDLIAGVRTGGLISSGSIVSVVAASISKVLYNFGNTDQNVQGQQEQED